MDIESYKLVIFYLGLETGKSTKPKIGVKLEAFGGYRCYLPKVGSDAICNSVLLRQPWA